MARDWLRPHAGLVVRAVALSFVVAAATSSYGLVMAQVFGWLREADTTNLARAPWAIVALVCVNAGFWFLQMWVTQALVLRVIEDMQRAMHGHLLRADFARVAGEAPGALAARFVSDVERVRETLTRAISNLSRDLLIVVGCVAVMVYLDWLMALLALIAYPLAFQPVAWLSKRLRRSSTQAQEEMGALGAFLTEGFAGDRLVKTYGLEAYQEGRGAARFAERFRIALAMARARAGVEPLLELFGGCALAGIIALSAWRVSTEGAASIDTLVGFLTALATLAPRARAVGSLGAVAQEGLAAAARIFEVLDEEPTIRDAPGAPSLGVSAGVVRFDQVSFAYGDGTQALNDVSLTLEPGKTTALVGPSGSGKSTLMNLLPRLYDPTSGQVLIDEADIRGVTLASLRAQIALVSQDATLFDDTIAANLRFGRPDADEAALWAALEAAAAAQFVRDTEGGLEAQVGPGGNRLSGGQRQRLSLARAILKDAPILLLDEATSALDAQSEATVQAALERAAAGRTTLVIAHRLATVMRADTIIVMQDGAIVERGDDASLTAAGGLYASLRALQFAQ